jgi:hypothetical protein
MTTPANSHPSTLTKTQQSLKERPGLRYALVGVVMLFVAVPQMFVAGTTASTGHYVLTGIGIALIAAGMITSFLKHRR